MTTQTQYTISAPCPGCANEVVFHRMPKLGEFISCTECGDMVEVVNLSPLALDWSTDIDDVAFIDDDDDNFDKESYD